VPIDVRRAKADRVDDLAGVMGRAFAADPILVWPFFGSFDLEARAIAVFKLIARQALSAKQARGFRMQRSAAAAAS
jgi:hypothetical protein